MPLYEYCNCAELKAAKQVEAPMHSSWACSLVFVRMMLAADFTLAFARRALSSQVMHYDEEEEVAGLLGVRFKKKALKDT